MLHRVFAFCLAAAISAAAQTPSPNPLIAKYGNNVAGTVRVKLDKRLDMKKAKVGDPVIAFTEKELKVGNDLLAKKHARVTGHVAEIMQKTKEQPINRVAVIFQSVQMPDGGELPLYGAITGVFDTTVTNKEDSIAEMQNTRLEHMEAEFISGDVTGEAAEAVNELSASLSTGTPTAASQTFNCKADAAGTMWCAPQGNTILQARRAEGFQDLAVQLEKTPRGPVGVLVSKRNIEVNGGIMLDVRFFSATRK